MSKVKQKGNFNKETHLCLIDASTYIFRAYHVMPPLTRPSDGLPVGAVNGFCSMIHRLLNQMAENSHPGAEHPITHIAAIFDASGRSFRNDLYPAYKAHRPPPPEDLVPQFPLTRDAARAFGLSVIEQEGLEADDLIASYATQARRKGARVTIISSDKDLMQLIDDRVVMLDTMKDKVISVKEVEEKFGVPPEKVTDIQALIGDSTDNIPGAPGIGIKSAMKLITEHGSLAALLKHPQRIENKRWQKIITENEGLIRTSHQLVCLKRDIAPPRSPDQIKFSPPEGKKLIAFLKAMEFKTLTQRVASKLGVDVEKIAAAKKSAPKE